MNNNDKNINERFLLKKAIEDGDTDAIAEIYENHKPFLIKCLANLVYLDGYAEDLVHDLFLVIKLGQCNYTGDTDVRGYLCGMAKKMALSSNRKEIKQGIIYIDFFSEEIVQAKPNKPFKNLNLKDTQNTILLEISKLPKKSRQAVELVLIHNFRPYQAAKKLDCSLDTLRKRLKRGQKRLRKELKFLSKNFAS